MHLRSWPIAVVLCALAGTNAILGASGNLIGGRVVNQVLWVTAEPPVRAYARRQAA
jgi:hypothetical protein